MDLIFININSNAKPFEDFIKPLEDRWSKFISKKDQKLIRHSTDNGYFNMTVNSNWKFAIENYCCLLYTSPSPRDRSVSRMPSSA